MPDYPAWLLGIPSSRRSAPVPEPSLCSMLRGSHGRVYEAMQREQSWRANGLWVCARASWRPFLFRPLGVCAYAAGARKGVRLKVGQRQEGWERSAAAGRLLRVGGERSARERLGRRKAERRDERRTPARGNEHLVVKPSLWCTQPVCLALVGPSSARQTHPNLSGDYVFVTEHGATPSCLVARSCSCLATYQAHTFHPALHPAQPS